MSFTSPTANGSFNSGCSSSLGQRLATIPVIEEAAEAAIDGINLLFPPSPPLRRSMLDTQDFLLSSALSVVTSSPRSSDDEDDSSSSSSSGSSPPGISNGRRRRRREAIMSSSSSTTSSQGSSSKPTAFILKPRSSSSSVSAISLADNRWGCYSTTTATRRDEPTSTSVDLPIFKPRRSWKV